MAFYEIFIENINENLAYPLTILKYTPGWFPDLYECHLLSTLPTFYKQLLRQYFMAKKLQSQTVIREKLCKTLLHKNLRVKC